MKTFLDGKFVDEKDALVSINEPGFLYAQGVFETMLADRRKIFRLNEHLERLVYSSRRINLDLPYSKQQLEDIIEKVLKINKFSPLVLRLTVWQGRDTGHLALMVKKYAPWPQSKCQAGFKAIISSVCQNENNFLANIKSSSRLHFLLAQKEAEAKGADEAILLNTKGNITEGTRTNIFLIKDDILYTPDKESGCLLGITRQAVLDIAKKFKIKSYEKKINLGELFSADEAFLTNSLIGVIPLTTLGNKKIGSTVAGKLTLFFRQKYQEAESEKY